LIRSSLFFLWFFVTNEFISLTLIIALLGRCFFFSSRYGLLRIIAVGCCSLLLRFTVADDYCSCCLLLCFTVAVCFCRLLSLLPLDGSLIKIWVVKREGIVLRRCEVAEDDAD